jgi:hypothetical protein
MAGGFSFVFCFVFWFAGVKAILTPPFRPQDMDAADVKVAKLAAAVAQARGFASLLDWVTVHFMDPIF